jgi:hypothetical protein
MGDGEMRVFPMAAIWTGLMCSCAIADSATIDIGAGSMTMHPQPRLGRIPIEPAFEDYSYMLFDLCDATGVDCIIYPMMGNIDNAVATLNDDGARIIVYDRRLSKKIGYEGAEAVIAHELGHHYCGHLSRLKLINHHEAEKEADRFMGFTMKKMGAKLSDLLDTYRMLGIDAESATHPSYAERALEIEVGFRAKSLESVCHRG